MKKKLFSVLSLVLVFTLLLCSVSGCGKKPAETSEDSVTPASAVPTADPTAEPIAEPTAEPTPEPDSEKINLLTGLPTLTEGAYGKRPVAVMINNVDAALPQYGISNADVIYELPVEADLTRLMAVYGDYTQMSDICSIRSCRYYYPILAVGMDAIYVHWGRDNTIALDTLNRLDIDHFDGSYDDGTLFGRDQDRRNSGYALEHTGVFYASKFAQYLADHGVRTDLKDDKKDLMFTFKPLNAEVSPNSDTAANSVTVEFGLNTSRFTYDAETGEYLKLYKNDPHIDSVTGEQLSFKNVLVLETDISVRDQKGRKNINWEGGPSYTGYYFTMGAVQRITWSKAGEYEPLKFFNENGEEIELNRGKSYIGFTYPGNISYTE